MRVPLHHAPAAKATAVAWPLNASEAEAGRPPTRQSQRMLDRRAATLNTVSPHLRDSYAATIMPLPRCQIPILTVAGLIQIAALQPLSPTRVSTGSSPTPPSGALGLQLADKMSERES